MPIMILDLYLKAKKHWHPPHWSDGRKSERASLLARRSLQAFADSRQTLLSSSYAIDNSANNLASMHSQSS